MTDYATWPWETVLATVLDIPISDRAEVTGQQWLKITEGSSLDQGSHLIWAASWQASRRSGTSIRIYLDPSLYTAGAAWDRFLSAPGDALFGSAPVTLVPRSFQAASLAIAGVTTGFHAMSRQFDTLHRAAAADTTPFRGRTGEIVAELFGGLHGVTLGVYDQMTSPVSYSDTVGEAGEAGRAFLADLRSAYTAWSQFPWHSPLGAVVQVLKEIAIQDGSGAYLIPDPQHTRYGDLTTAGAWASVEQQAKSRWTGLLTGDSGDFAGLDLLGRTALGKLTGQYAASMRSLVPVTGPAPLTRPSADGPAAARGDGELPAPDSGRPSSFVTPGRGPVTLGLETPGPGIPGPGQPPAAGPSGAEGFPGLLGFPGPAGFPVSVATPGSSASGDGPVTGQDELSQPDVVWAPAEAIGSAAGPGGSSSAGARDVPDRDVPDRADGKHFTGTIGRSSRHGQAADDPAAGKPTTGPRTAPAAGYSLGRGPHGSVLHRSVVPAISPRPLAVRSSTVNTQLNAAGGEGGGFGGTAPPVPPAAGPAAAGPAMPGPSAGSQAIGLQVPGEGSTAMIANQGLPGSAGGVLGLPGGQPGSGDVVMMPPPARAGGLSQQGRSRPRRVYLPEEAAVWGAEPGLPEPIIGDGAPRPDSEPDFAIPHPIVGIGAEAEPKAST